MWESRSGHSSTGLAKDMNPRATSFCKKKVLLGECHHMHLLVGSPLAVRDAGPRSAKTGQSLWLPHMSPGSWAGAGVSGGKLSTFPVSLSLG